MALDISAYSFIALTGACVPLLEKRGATARLILNRPEKGNSYNQALLDALSGEVTRLGADRVERRAEERRRTAIKSQQSQH